MGIDPARFWANLFLYHYENKFITNIGSRRDSHGFKYHGVMRFIDDLCAINDGGDFGNSFLNIYPPELELKVEHEGPHATFLDLNISIAGNRFINYMTNEIALTFLLFGCLRCVVTYHLLFSMVLFCLNF